MRIEKENPNTNCLEDFECPKCGSFGPFDIASQVTATVYDDGVEETQGFEWGNHSACTCKACNHVATVAEFEGLPKPADPTREQLINFAKSIANLWIWDWDDDDGNPLSECDTPSEGHADSHAALMTQIEEARHLLKSHE